MTYRIPVALAALCLAGFAGSAEASDRTRFECRASGASDISMSARYEVRGTGPNARRKFTTEFEAAPNAGFREGQRLAFRVDGVIVGRLPLDQIAGGDLVADLNFDTQPQADAEPFPGNFPAGVGRRTPVAILKGGDVVLSCVLR